MKVAIVDGDVSYPTTSGKRLRTLNLMLRCAERHKIVYLGRLTGEKDDHPEARTILRDHGIEPIFVHDPLPKKSGPAFYGRLVGNLFNKWPYSVQSHQSDKMRSAVERVRAEHAIDAWQIEWPPYLPMVARHPKSPRVMIAHNVEALIWQRYYETATNPAKRAFLKSQWRKFAEFERWAMNESEGVVAVSEEDAKIIETQFGRGGVDVVDNGVDPAFYAQVGGLRDAKCVLFVGALDWRPNQDGVDLLLDRIFPEVRREIPDAKLRIVGRNPSARLKERIASVAGAELHGDVADVRPFLGEAGMLAVPLRIGGGSRLKILEALASNLPVIASRVGAEGLNLTPGEHYVQAEESNMAAAIVAAMREPGPILSMTERGRDVVRREYDWAVLATKLEAAWENAIRGR